MDDMDRRSLLRGSLALGGLALTAHTSTTALLLETIAPSPTPSCVTTADIDGVTIARSLFDGLELSRGGGFAFDAAIAQLRSATRLLDASCSERLRPRLYTAVGELANTVGFMAFDCGRPSDARRILDVARSCAEEADNPGLRLAVSAHLAMIDTAAGRPRAAISSMDAALASGTRLSPTERAYAWSTRARALGRLGDTHATYASIGEADDAMAASSRDDEPAGIHWYAAEHEGVVGHALYELTQSTGDGADRAVTRQTAAVASLPPAAFGRARANAHLKLATIAMTTGDPDEAAATGIAAVDAAATIRSVRTREYLRTLHHATAAHADRPAVVELRDRTAAALMA